MKLSAPIHSLKHRARALSRREGVPLHVALDRIAGREGFAAWSHLASSWQRQARSRAVYEQLREGDLALIGSRPGQGKTLLGAGLAIEAMSRGYHAAFFTLEFTAAQVGKLFGALGRSPAEFQERWLLDTSDEISAESVARRVEGAPPSTLVVIDYLQLLDQRRDKPSLDLQLRRLKRLAREGRAMVVCLSQIGRESALTSTSFPSLGDVRLPNPADPSLFDKACFLQGGKMQLQRADSNAAF